MNILVSYDISHNGLRLKLANQLWAHGLIRIQYSVFIGQIPDRYMNRLKKALKQITGEIKWTPEDAILLLPLHQYSQDHIQVWGEKSSDVSLLVDPPHTMFL